MRTPHLLRQQEWISYLDHKCPEETAQCVEHPTIAKCLISTASRHMIMVQKYNHIITADLFIEAKSEHDGARGAERLFEQHLHS